MGIADVSKTSGYASHMFQTHVSVMCFHHMFLARVSGFQSLETRYQENHNTGDGECVRHGGGSVHRIE